MKSFLSSLLFLLGILMISIIVACGNSVNGGSQDNDVPELVIPEAQGILDDTFNDGEAAIYDSGTDDYAWAMALQHDDKIVVTGQSGPDLLLLRFNADGTPDTNFGTNGSVPWDMGFTASGRAVQVQKDGNILVAGYGTCQASDLDFMLARFNADGTPDLGFGSWGVVCWGEALSEVGMGMAVQPDGKIVVVGHQSTASNVDMIMVRFNKDGTVDSSFGSAGTVMWDNAQYDYGWDVSVTDGGKILVTGNTHIDSEGYDGMVVWRFNNNGTLDTSFGTNGLSNWGSAGGPSKAMTLQTDGKILVTGQNRNPVTRNDDFVLVRFNTDGSLDNAFDEDGIVIKDTFMNEHGADVVSMPNRKILSGFTRFDPYGNMGIVLIRYNSDGIIDENFGTSGIVSWDSPMEDHLSSIGIQSTGEIIAAGYKRNGTDQDVLVLGFK